MTNRMRSLLAGACLALLPSAASAQYRGGYPARPGWQSGFQAVPYLGVHSYQDDDHTVYETGLRLGALLGGRLAPNFSLNGEITVDRSRFEDPGLLDELSETYLELALSPLVHLPVGMGELVLGPKLGLFSASGEVVVLGQTVDGSASGLLAGINFGAFFPVTPDWALGGLLSFESRDTRRRCIGNGSGSAEVCDDVTEEAAAIFSVAVGAMF